ncbi:MAG: hypothetical protein HPY74_01310 [Firmicutes bacterium]|nr:hypothetical protein [Bacillota bacterium]
MLFNKYSRAVRYVTLFIRKDTLCDCSIKIMFKSSPSAIAESTSLISAFSTLREILSDAVLLIVSKEDLLEIPEVSILLATVLALFIFETVDAVSDDVLFQIRGFITVSAVTAVIK